MGQNNNNIFYQGREISVKRDGKISKRSFLSYRHSMIVLLMLSCFFVLLLVIFAKKLPDISVGMSTKLIPASSGRCLCIIF